MNNTRFFKCDCNSHGIEVIIDKDENEVILVLWKYQFNRERDNIFRRMRSAFDYIFNKKSLTPGEILLSKEKALEMAKFIEDVL